MCGGEISSGVGCLGFLYSLFIRTELSVIGSWVLFGDYQLYNSQVTSHGLIMLFGFIIPITTGAFANYFLPVLVSIPDLVFPRMNTLSFLVYLLGVALLLVSSYIEEGVGTG